MTRAEAIAATQALTRRYARRQNSWFRRYAALQWLPSGDPDLLQSAVDVVGRSAQE
jgi:tRNA dimethylallyltransferase